MAGWDRIGAAAETIVVDPDHVFPLPDEVDFVAGACLPMNYLTAHFALLIRGGLRSGKVVLVHGAAGGVGASAGDRGPVGCGRAPPSMGRSCPAFARGEVVPTIARVRPLAEVRDGLADLAARRTVGKTVLRLRLPDRAAQPGRAIDLSSKYSSSPSGPISRPIPDCL